MKTFNLLVYTLLFVAFGCRKADYLSLPQYDYAEKVLQLPPNASPTLQRIAKELERQNNLPAYRGYLNDFGRKEGLPRWDKAQIKISTPRGTAYRSAAQQDTVVVIPLVLENEDAVNGFLQASLSATTVTIGYYNIKDYNRFPFRDEQHYSAEDFVGLVIKMNYEVFGYKKFKVLDKRLFNDSTAITSDAPFVIKIKGDSIISGERPIVIIELCKRVFNGVAACTCQPKPTECKDWQYCNQCGSDDCTSIVLWDDPLPPLPTVGGELGSEDENAGNIGNQNGENHGGGQGGAVGGSGPPESGGNPLPDCADISPVLPSGYHQPCKRGPFIPVINIGEEGVVLDDEEIIPEAQVLGNFEDDPTVFEEDTTQISFNFHQDPWPSIQNVLSSLQFVEYNFENCLALAKAQIAKAGVNDLGYGSAYKIYDALGGPYPDIAKFGVEYIITKLKSGLPVIVGIDNRPGTPSAKNADGRTDHFVSIVGCGQDAQGKYFTFFDNATNDVNKGTSSSNKLYYDQSTGILSGKSAAPFANAYYNYIVTQVRKNK